MTKSYETSGPLTINLYFYTTFFFFYKYSIFPTGVFVQQSKAILVGNQIRNQECCHFSLIGHHSMAGNSSAILLRFSSSGSLSSPTHTYPCFWVDRGIVRDWSPWKYRIPLKILKRTCKEPVLLRQTYSLE